MVRVNLMIQVELNHFRSINLDWAVRQEIQVCCRGHRVTQALNPLR